MLLLVEGLYVVLESLRPHAEHVTVGALDLGMDLLVVDLQVLLRGELSPADVAGMGGRCGRMCLLDVFDEALLSPADGPALGAFLASRVDGVGVVDQVVPSTEGLVAELALEGFRSVDGLDVRVQTPLRHQGPSALPADVPALGVDLGVFHGPLLHGGDGLDLVVGGPPLLPDGEPVAEVSVCFLILAPSLQKAVVAVDVAVVVVVLLLLTAVVVAGSPLLRGRWGCDVGRVL